MVYNYLGKVGFNFVRVIGIKDENKMCSYVFFRENWVLIWEKVLFGSL